jgi:8-oxo-dGTP pyrophosphatase MutT (NUDIX family)
MIEKEETKFAVNAILISTHGEVILQERDNKPGIVNPGLWCLFGGTLKEGETKWKGLRRELYEELELTYLGEQVEFFKTYKKTVEKDGIEKIIDIYVIKNIDIRKLVLHEGKSLIIDWPENILKNMDKITRISGLALQEYFSKK